MNTEFISNETIEALILSCESILNPVKEKIKIYNKKYNTKFSSNRNSNCEILGNYAKAHLWNNNREYRKAIEESNCDFVFNPEYKKFPTGISGRIIMERYVWTYLLNEMSEEWNFFLNIFDYSKFFEREISQRIKPIIENYSNVDLLEINDYKKFWNQYSKINVDSKIVETTNKITETLTNLYVELLKNFDKSEIEEKYKYLNSVIRRYIIERDEIRLHKTLLELDFWNIEKENRRINFVTAFRHCHLLPQNTATLPG